MNQIAENIKTETSSPPGTYQNHNWEEIFESTQSGVIPLVRQAKTIEGLRQCTLLVIQNLFTRDDDAPIRNTYEQSLDDILPSSGPDTPTMDQGVSRIVQLLREIKMYRQTKHEENERNRAAGIFDTQKSERREDDEPVTLPGLEVCKTLKEPVSDDDEQNIDSLFADLFCDRIRQRLSVLNNNIKSVNGPPPFLLSKDFANHFESILRQHFIPSFLEDSRALVARTAQQPLESRRQYLQEQFDGRVSSQNLWDKWQDTWANLVHAKELPEKPEPVKKAGLLGGLKMKKKKKKVPAWMRELTIEEWQVQTKEIKAANKKAKKIWTLIALSSEAYQAPQFSDEKLLMDFFARSAKGLQDHINALRQIAEQGVEIGRNLSTYAQGKNIDLPLLAVCHQCHELFLGEGQGLKKMTIGMDDVDISKTYPLVKRFLNKHL